MRTSLDFPEPVFRELKVLAARRGVTLRSIILGAVEKELAIKKPSGHRVRAPLVPAKGRRRIQLSNAEIEDLLA